MIRFAGASTTTSSSSTCDCRTCSSTNYHQPTIVKSNDPAQAAIWRRKLGEVSAEGESGLMSEEDEQGSASPFYRRPVSVILNPHLDRREDRPTPPSPSPTLVNEPTRLGHRQNLRSPKLARRHWRTPLLRPSRNLIALASFSAIRTASLN